MPSITASRAENLPIGQLSRLSGVNVETIRYYERIKMLPPPPRSGGGRRIYDQTHLRTLVFFSYVGPANWGFRLKRSAP
jgi:MerR family mercuric resistance operon transcriptional regulator